MDSLLRLADVAGQETFTVVADLKGWSFRNFSLPLLRLMIAILQDYYPERLGRVLVLSTPMAFRAAWNMIYPLLDERTRIKIHLCGSNAKDELLKIIDADVLEKEYGGSHSPPYPCRDPLISPLYEAEERLLVSAAGAVKGASDDEELAASQIDALNHKRDDEVPEKLQHKRKRPYFSRTKLRMMISRLTQKDRSEMEDEPGSPQASPSQRRPVSGGFTKLLGRSSTLNAVDEGAGKSAAELEADLADLAKKHEADTKALGERIGELAKVIKALGGAGRRASDADQSPAASPVLSSNILLALFIALLSVQLFCLKEISALRQH
jgi:hypothetical protein